MTIDPAAISLIQNTFLQHLNHGLSIVSKYANQLFIILAGIEIVLLGLTWAFSQNAISGSIFLKLLKICLIFLIIQEYAHFINAIFKSFVQIAGNIGDKQTPTTYFTTPSLLWKYAYDSSIFLIQAATQSTTIGLILLELALGLGILLTFILLSIQILLYYIGFYLVAFIALIMIPISVFSGTSGVLQKSIYSILEAGIRLMVMMIIIAIAVAFFQYFQLDTQVIAKDSSINNILGILFAGLVFFFLAKYLPDLAARTIGSIINTQVPDHESHVVVQTPAVSTMQQSASPVFVNAMQAATMIEAANTMSPQMNAATETLSASESSNPNVISPLATQSAQDVQVNMSGQTTTSHAAGISSTRLSDSISLKDKALNHQLSELNKNLKSLAQKDKKP